MDTHATWHGVAVGRILGGDDGRAMAVQLNHTIVPARDKAASAGFLAEILGLEPPSPFGPFLCVETANGVSLDYADRAVPFETGHYAFLVTEAEFDAVFARVTERGLTYWADPGHTQAGRINQHGRGFYFEDPDGHNMEVLTRPYGT
jgi:catechol 2,3-dioxygenase-like lactoylglutathione lyase family enzyme